ncbi:Uncharacterized protein Rs2_35695 [Raphanus sativus]|nr:Uncharacterized protein Rs2_35695 [Raphanus sativus]
MEDFLELEEFLELEGGKQLGDLDSSVEVTMEDFIELEEWLESKQKLYDERNTMRKDLETSSKARIDRYQHDEIDRYPPFIIDLHPPEYIDRHTCLDELPGGCTVKLEPIEERMHKSETSYLAVPEHLRPICAEEAAGICKRVKRIHDPVKIVVPCTVVEAESHIPPDRDGVRKSRMCKRNFSHPFAKLKALLIAEMIDKGEKTMGEAFTQE